MDNVKIYFLNATSGTGKNGEYYRICLLISEKNNGQERDYTSNFYVEADTYIKAKNFEKFQEVDAIFMPKSSEGIKLISIEGL